MLNEKLLNQETERQDSFFYCFFNWAEIEKNLQSIALNLTIFCDTHSQKEMVKKNWEKKLCHQKVFD